MKRVLPRVLSVLLLVAVIALCLFLLFRAGLLSLTREELQERLASYGALAPLAFLIVTFLQVTFVPLPSTVTILGGSYLFGALPSFFYSYIGLLSGAVVAFWLGRLLGKPFVDWLVGGERVDRLIARARGRETVLLFFMFLLPAFPDDVLCLVAGLLPIRFRTFLLMQLPTRALTIGVTLLFFSGEVIPFTGWGIAVMAVAIVIGVTIFVLSLVYTERLNALAARLSARLHPRHQKKGDLGDEDT